MKKNNVFAILLIVASFAVLTLFGCGKKAEKSAEYHNDKDDSIAEFQDVEDAEGPGSTEDFSSDPDGIDFESGDEADTIADTRYGVSTYIREEDADDFEEEISIIDEDEITTHPVSSPSRGAYEGNTGSYIIVTDENGSTREIPNTYNCVPHYEHREPNTYNGTIGDVQ